MSKRSLDSVDSLVKRARAPVIARLCDTAEGNDVFAHSLNALRAREKGILRSREASTKYEEVCRPRVHGPHPPTRASPHRSRALCDRSCATHVAYRVCPVIFC